LPDYLRNILSEDIKFNIYDRSLFDLVEVGYFPGEGDYGDLK
jgi:hypothetical protein